MTFSYDLVSCFLIHVVLVFFGFLLMIAVGICSTYCSSSEFLSSAHIEIQVCQNYATSAALANITRQGFKREQINQINPLYFCVC